MTCPITSYGFAEDAQVRAAINVRAEAGQMRFTVQRRNVTLPDMEVVLNLAGRAQRAQRAVGHCRGGGAEHP